MTSQEPKIFVTRKSRSGWFWVLGVLLCLLMVAGILCYWIFSTENSVADAPIESRPSSIPQVSVLTPVGAAPVQAVPTVPNLNPAIDELNQSLVLHLPLRSSLEDKSPNRHAVTAVGKLFFTTEGAYFPGDTFLVAPHIPLNEHGFTFALWIKPEGSAEGYCLLQQREGGEKSRHLHFMLRDPARPYMGFMMNDLNSNRDIQANVWSHLVFEYTGVRQQIWLNGALIAERDAMPFLGQSGETTIGKSPQWNNVKNHQFKGIMRDVRIYDVPLMPEQIQTISKREEDQIDGPSAPPPGARVREEQF